MHVPAQPLACPNADGWWWRSPRVRLLCLSSGLHAGGFGRAIVRVCRTGASHGSAKTNAFCDSAVFRIVKAGICDLQSIDRRLDGRNLRGKAGFADGLAVAKAGYLCSENVLRGQCGIQPLETTEGLFEQLVVRPGELRVAGGHVIRDVDDGSRDVAAEVGEFNNAGNRKARNGDVDPEVLCYGLTQLEDDADDSNV